MRISYDPEVDAAYITVVDQIGSGEAVKQVIVPREETNAEFILDFDSEGSLLGIEVLAARSGLRPETIRKQSDQPERTTNGQAGWPRSPGRERIIHFPSRHPYVRVLGRSARCGGRLKAGSSSRTAQPSSTTDRYWGQRKIVDSMSTAATNCCGRPLPLSSVSN